jgi:hypothetical protein
MLPLKPMRSAMLDETRSAAEVVRKSAPSRKIFMTPASKKLALPAKVWAK